MRPSHPFHRPWKSPSAVISHIPTARRLRRYTDISIGLVPLSFLMSRNKVVLLSKISGCCQALDSDYSAEFLHRIRTLLQSRIFFGRQLDFNNLFQPARAKFARHANV